jgi:hypothetical protein
MGMQEAWARLYAPRTPRDVRGLWFVVTFVNRAGPQRLIGPHASLWLASRALRGERFGPTLAEGYYRVETDSPVMVHFAGQEQSLSRSFGPFTHFSVIDRLVHADGKALAMYNPKIDQWLCYDAGRHWPALVVSSFGPAAQS